jgi:hypothetical protein
MAIGPGGKLYAGWSATYGTAGGGFTELDLATNKSRAWSSDTIAPEVSIGSVACDDKYLYGVTSNEFNGLTRPPKPLTFFVFDPNTGKVVFQQMLENVTGAPKIIRVPDMNSIWLAHSTGVQKFDREGMKLSAILAWPKETAASTSVDARDARDDRAWFAVGSTIVQLHDGKAPELEMLFTTATGIQSLTVSQTHLYYTQGTQVWSAPLK